MKVKITLRNALTARDYIEFEGVDRIEHMWEHETGWRTTALGPDADERRILAINPEAVVAVLLEREPVDEGRS